MMHWLMPEFTSCKTYSIIWKLCENMINCVFAYLLSGSEREIEEIKIWEGKGKGKRYQRYQITSLQIRPE